MDCATRFRPAPTRKLCRRGRALNSRRTAAATCRWRRSRDATATPCTWSWSARQRGRAGAASPRAGVGAGRARARSSRRSCWPTAPWRVLPGPTSCDQRCAAAGPPLERNAVRALGVVRRRRRCRRWRGRSSSSTQGPRGQLQVMPITWRVVVLKRPASTRGRVSRRAPAMVWRSFQRPRARVLPSRAVVGVRCRR